MRSVFAFLLLRYALHKEYGICDVPQFTINEHGKPFLSDYPDIYFSMSHCTSAVVCAVSRSPVGADIQDIRRLSLSIAGKFLTPAELERISLITDVEQRDKELCRLWSIKESFSKMTGKGFSEGFTGIDTGRLTSEGRALWTFRNGCYISVCI